jgi:prophage DNA circulation protein
MAWRDEMGRVTLPDGRVLVGGRFRGVPFRTVDAEIKVGRRNVVNEYPQRDLPYVDDLGRKARRFVVDAYVIGDNYFAERDALIEAFETKGSGELIHPRYGSRKVSVEGDVSIKESPERGGMARISVTFVEDTSNTFPKSVEDTVSQLEAATNAADEATEAAFAEEFSVEGPSVLASQAMDGLRGLTSTVAGLLQMARQVTSVGGLATIAGLVGGLTGNLAALIRTPVVLVQSLRSIYAQLVQELRRPVSAFAELQSVFFANKRSPAVALSGSTRARSLANDTARADLQRRLSLTNQARVLAVAIQPLSTFSGRRAVATTGSGGVRSLSGQMQATGVTVATTTATDTTAETVIATSEQAVALRDALIAQIDAEIEVNDPPAQVALTLSRVRAAVVRDVAARSEFLQSRSTYTPQAVLPALVLAHRIYQDATRADELVARNSVSHPAFMPARPLEVLR